MGALVASCDPPPPSVYVTVLRPHLSEGGSYAVLCLTVYLPPVRKTIRRVGLRVGQVSSAYLMPCVRMPQSEHIALSFGGCPRVGRTGRPRYKVQVIVALTLFCTPR